MWSALLLPLDPASIISTDHAGPTVSALTVFGVLAVSLALVVVAAVNAVIYRRRAAQAEAAYDPAAPLRLSPGQTTVFGTVDYARDAEQAVRVEVDQVGTERESSGSWSHSWEESDRRAKVRPFYLRHASGARVRVEPTSEVFLVDAMDGVIRVNLTLRTRVAELTPDEQVYAVGVLTRDHDPEARPEQGGLYRSAPTGYVLRPARSGPMLLSTEPLGARFLQRAQTYRKVGLILALAMVGFQLLMTPYHARLLGETIEGKVAQKTQHTTTDDDGDEHHHYKVYAQVEGVGVVADELKHEVYKALREEDAIPARVSAMLPEHWSTLGPNITADLLYVIIGLVVVALMIGGYWVAAQRRRWYEATVFDIGSGRLQESLETGQESVDSK